MNNETRRNAPLKVVYQGSILMSLLIAPWALVLFISMLAGFLTASPIAYVGCLTVFVLATLQIIQGLGINLVSLLQHPAPMHSIQKNL